MQKRGRPPKRPEDVKDTQVVFRTNKRLRALLQQEAREQARTEANMLNWILLERYRKQLGAK